MTDDYQEEDSNGANEARHYYCEGCRVLMEALRDIEQQCREAEDAGISDSPLSAARDVEVLIRNEEAYLVKLSKLQRRRDFALEVLLKHQSLEHT